MEPGASSSAPPNLDLPPLKEPGLKQDDLQKLQLQVFENRRPGEVLPLHAIDNLTPRKCFTWKYRIETVTIFLIDIFRKDRD